MTEKVLFLTGHLAEENLNAELEAFDASDAEYRVHNIGVKVAALMTSNIITRRLGEVADVDRVVLPGLFGGDTNLLAEHFGVPFERGPKDLRDLPEYLGGAKRTADLSQHNMLIFAEIVDAPKMSVASILEQANNYRANGADVIDVGCLPEVPFDHLEETVRALKSDGFKVSIDSLEEADLLRGCDAGADYLLSLRESTIHLAERVNAIPILIPESTGDVTSLYRAIDYMVGLNKPFMADAILDPFPFGMLDSLIRYRELRKHYPNIDILMGTGNVTELMDADTGGITAVLLALGTEIGIGAILTTEVSSTACRAVSEAELARRIMFAAKRDGQLARRYDSGLLGVHDRKPFPYAQDEIEAIAANIRDKNYRVQVSEAGVHIYNRDGIVLATDPFEFKDALLAEGVDASHMYYLGVELARAQIAWQLGKRYLQDNELEWGVASRREK